MDICAVSISQLYISVIINLKQITQKRQCATLNCTCRLACDTWVQATYKLLLYLWSRVSVRLTTYRSKINRKRSAFRHYLSQSVYYSKFMILWRVVFLTLNIITRELYRRAARQKQSKSAMEKHILFCYSVKRENVIPGTPVNKPTLKLAPGRILGIKSRKYAVGVFLNVLSHSRE